MTEKKLEERISFPFDFYGDIYKIAFADDHGLYVPVRDICGSLGVDTQAQTRRIRRSSTLSEGLARVKMATDYQEGVRMREVLCLNVELIPEWISGVDESRISEESLPAILRLKKEFSLIVKAYFRGAIIPEDLKAEIDSALPTALRDLYEQAEKMALYVHDVRHELKIQTSRMDNLEKRMVGLEAKAEGKDYITDFQASKVLDMIKALGYQLELRGERSYGHVHSTLKRKFHYTKYTKITQKIYPKVVEYLTQWYQYVVGPEERLPETFTRPDQPELF